MREDLGLGLGFCCFCWFLDFIRYDDMIGIFDDGLPWRLLDLGNWDSLVGLLGWCLVIGFFGLNWVFGFFA